MLGDSFCKLITPSTPRSRLLSFQSPCLGTLFASWLKSYGETLRSLTFNPHAWGLFLQGHLRVVRSFQEAYSFQSPCLGTLFASLQWGQSAMIQALTFQSPCLGTLFASHRSNGTQKPGRHRLSIPMLGDSFCKFEGFRPEKTHFLPFNPHAWGLFLQAFFLPFLSSPETINFQSPCLGTLFAS